MLLVRSRFQSYVQWASRRAKWLHLATCPCHPFRIPTFLQKWSAVGGEGMIVTVEVPQHPLEGPVVCLVCAGAIQDGFSYMSVSDIATVIQESEEFHKKFLAAREYRLGRADRDWGDETAKKSVGLCAICDVVYEGYTAGGIKQSCNVDPTSAGFVGVPFAHPVTGPVVELFYVPRAGPMVEMRIRSRRGAEWAENMMQTQSMRNKVPL